MAVSTNFFGLRRKSTKSHTYQVFRGKQVTKDRVTDVANPQSDEQMDQRLVLPLVSNARSKLNSIINHSFEGVDYGYKSIYEFMRLNLAKGAVTPASYVPKGFGDCGIADFIIAKGTLESATFTERNGAAVFSFSGNTLAESSKFANQAANEKLSQENAELLATYLGLEAGDQLTVVCGGFYGGDIEFKDLTCRRTGFVISRLILGGDDFDNNPAWRLTQAITDDSESGVLQITDGYLNLHFEGISSDNHYLGFLPTISDSLNQYTEEPSMYACILSRKDDNLWRRSDTRFNILDSNLVNAISLAAAKPSYLKTTSSSAKYLNSGVDGVSITGGDD